MESGYLGIEAAAQRLRQGGIVGMPTETVYGLAAMATNPVAVARIFEAKGRPTFDPLIVHIPDLDWLPRVARDIGRDAERLAEQFWPGPLTLILPRHSSIPDLVTSGLDTVGVRLPSHPLARELIRAVGVPLAAPSANRFGRTSPTTAAHVLDQLAGKIDGVVDGGSSTVGVESTIIAFPDGVPTLLRPGGVTVEELRPHLCATLQVPPVGIIVPGAQPLSAPGTLASHYCPDTPLQFLETEELPLHLPERWGWIGFGPGEVPSGCSASENLSFEGNTREAATRLYAVMRQMDTLGLELILAQKLPPEGLGLAVNDRLRRAGTRR